MTTTEEQAAVPEEPPRAVAAPEPSPSSRRRRTPSLLAFLAALLLGLGVSFFFERAQTRDRVLRGVMVGNVHLGGLSEEALQRALAQQARRVKTTPIALTLETRRLQRTAAALGVNADQSGAAAKALGEGRHGTLASQFAWWLARLVSPRSIELPIDVSLDELQAEVRPWSQRVLPEPVEPKIHFDGDLRGRNPKAGFVVEYGALKTQLLRELKRVRTGTPEKMQIAVPTVRLDPVIGQQEVDARLAEARQLISAPITLVTPDGEQRIQLTPEQLGRSLDSKIQGTPPRLVVTLWPERVRRFLVDFLSGVEVAPQDARFEPEATGNVRILPSHEGLLVDDAKLVDALLTASKVPQRRAVLPVAPKEPDLTTTEAEQLGIKGLVASFATRHPCCQPRVDNIHVAAKQVDGVVLEPGDRFSLNEFLGPRSGSPLYKKAPTIVHGEMKQTEGGGISQFATTLFNAVLDGGYAIVQRQPHSFYFPRYPEGHEATVSFPQPDLVFENDSQAGLLIKTRFDSTSIRVLLYGDNGGRRVTRRKSQRFDVTQPPIEYEADPEMKPDAAVRLSSGQIGWSLLVARIIHYPDGRLVEQERKVVYKPRPRLVRVHPCDIPKGHPGHSKDPCPTPEEPENENSSSEESFDEDAPSPDTDREFLDDSVSDEERVDWDVSGE